MITTEQIEQIANDLESFDNIKLMALESLFARLSNMTFRARMVVKYKSHDPELSLSYREEFAYERKEALAIAKQLEQAHSAPNS